MGIHVELDGKGTLGHATYEHGLSSYEAKGDSSLYLNLAGTRWIDPYALVAITCLVHRASAIGAPTQFLVPNDPDTARYVSRAGLGHELDAAGVQHDLPPVRKHDVHGRMVELTRFAGDGVDHLGGMVLTALVNQGAKEAVAKRVASCVWEGASNVDEHSHAENGGVVSAQLYGRYGSRPVLVWAVGDAGIGVRQSLARKYDVTDDRHAVELAVGRDVTSTDDDRGLGLNSVIEQVSVEQAGDTYLRSGGARLTARGDERTVADVTPVTGTILAGSIDCSGLVTNPVGWTWSS